MATFGRLMEFGLEGEDWEQYVERMEHYFEANDIDNVGKKKSILLSACGSATYKLMCDLVAPAKPGEKTYEELKQVVLDHLKPKPSEIVQRFKFHTRTRAAEESVAVYVSQLRHLSSYCNFGDALESMIRDRLVCGINHDRMQRRLLATPDLTFKKALDIATAMELAEKSAADIQGNLVCERGATSSANAEGPHVVHAIQKEKEKKDIECWFCKRKGHMQRQCRQYRAEQAKRKFGKGKNAAVRNVEECQQNSESDSDVYTMYKTQSKEKPYLVTVSLQDIPVEMEIDTGASLTVISEETLKKVRRDTYLPLQKCHRRLRTYTGEEIPVLGTCSVQVTYKNSTPVSLELIVVKGTGPSLLGRDWLKCLRLNWSEIFALYSGPSAGSVVTDGELQQILNENAEVFEDGRGTITGVQARIVVDGGAKPRYFKPRPVPYAVRDKVNQELDRLEAEGTIEKVQYSDWAAPIVTVMKPDKTVRICGDYKVTVNAASKLDNYPIPRTEDLLAELSEGKYFSKLDLKQAYQQLELDESSKEYTTINTHQGLYRYHRLPFGISSAPGIFQRTMDKMLKGIPHVLVRLDDILVVGRTRTQHLDTLRKVLHRLKTAGARLKKDKCVFLANELTYLGLKIDQTGIKPISEKMQAIQDMPRPTDVKQLQAFLGMVNYYARFIPNLAAVLSPLYVLLKKDQKWAWNETHDKAWRRAKMLLQSPKVLVHFDSAKDIVLSCDASNYGLGAVLSHKMADGSERPVAFVSRTLNSAEKNYSQIEKEALAVIFGIKKFHQYMFGHQFEIHTDHKPLLSLLKENEQVPVMAAARMQRWALLLSSYEYTIAYKEGKKHSNADGLSRLPLDCTEEKK